MYVYYIYIHARTHAYVQGEHAYCDFNVMNLCVFHTIASIICVPDL